MAFFECQYLHIEHYVIEDILGNLGEVLDSSDHFE